MSFTTNTVVSDGVTTQYPVAFTNGIYDRKYVKVYVEDDVDGSGNQLQRDFTWINDGLIELDVAAPSGKDIIIRRELNRAYPDVDYVNGAILDEQNLNQSMDQLIGLVQEIFDGVGIESFNRDIDMNGFRLTNLGVGSAESDSVTLSQVQGIIANLSDGTVFIKEESQTGAQVVSDITTFTSVTFTPGLRNLLVFLNGVKQKVGRDYLELTGNRIQWVADVSATDDIDAIVNLTTTSVTNTDASLVDYIPSIGNTRTVEAHLRATDRTYTVTELQALSIPPSVAVLSDRGYGIFDKVLTSSVTPNGYNILISTTVPEYSFVLRQRDNVFDAEHWGMVADGAADFTSGTDNSGVWQAIIDSTENNGAVINLPNGRINILTPIDYGVSGIDRISTRGGNGTDGTIVFTTASITQLVRLPTSTGNTNNVAGGEFIAIDFNAQENADYCIKGYGNHMLFRDCRFRKAVIAGTDVSFGYDNMWDHCYWRDNLQDGEIMDQGQNNQNTHIGCKYFDNGRFGVFAKSSLALSYTNCLFEQNSGAAIFAFGLDGIHLDNCYFDRNGMASLGGGHTFSTPSQTVYADIILTGSSSTTTMSVGTPCKGVTITSPFVSGSAADAHTHVYAISSEGLTVNNATLNDGDIGDLVTTYGSTTTSSQYSRNKGLRIGRENNFDNKLVVQNSTTGFAGQEDMIIEDIDVINIIDTDLTNWLAVVGGGGTFTNSTEQHSLGPKVSVHELDFASTSTSSQFGFNVDVTDYPALTGEPMLACIDVKADSSNTPTITFQADGCTRTSSSTDWTRLYVIFNMPASGTIRFSVKKGSGTGKAYVSIPILCRLGNDNRKLIGTI